MARPVYLDCNATSPVDARVQEVVLHYLRDEFGNAGSRTHDYGTRAQHAVRLAREQVAQLVRAAADEVFFTSGATESNNLAILGIAAGGPSTTARHVIATCIEHKAVLEPVAQLGARGFEVTLVPPTPGGWVDPDTLAAALRADTCLVTVMHANNETGVLQPLRQIADRLRDHHAYLHTDAAQSYGKDSEQLTEPRIDLISISGHKIYGPKGIGALVARRRDGRRPPLKPLMYGGGQERGLRPGTVPVPLVAGLGLASELAVQEGAARAAACRAFRQVMMDGLAPLRPTVNGDPGRALPHVLNLSFGDLDSEAVIVALKGVVAISNGAACTATTYEPSHVLKAMGLTAEQASCATRWSWWHGAETPDWGEVVQRVSRLA